MFSIKSILSENINLNQIENLISPQTAIFLFSSDNDLHQLLAASILQKQQFILIGNKQYYDMKVFMNYDINKIISLGIDELSDILMEYGRQFQQLIILINLNVLDICYSPTSQNKTAGGLSTKELFYILSRLQIIKNQKIIYVYNYDLKKDQQEITAKLLERFSILN